MTAKSLTAGGIEVELSHTDKVLFPGDEITKGDLIEYYADVADRMLPYLRERPIAMARYPDGIKGPRIFQKNVPDYFPDWITRTEVKKQGGVLHHVICDKPATVVYLANQACIELHVFLSQVGQLDHPDQLVFDLDPPGDDQFGEARRAALLLRDLLEGELGLTTFVKTTGGHGLHVYVPLRPVAGFDTVRGFARQAAGVLTARGSRADHHRAAQGQAHRPGVHGRHAQRLRPDGGRPLRGQGPARRPCRGAAGLGRGSGPHAHARPVHAAHGPPQAQRPRPGGRPVVRPGPAPPGPGPGVPAAGAGRGAGGVSPTRPRSRPFPPNVSTPVPGAAR